MSGNDDVNIIDPIIELKNEWTVYTTRQKGREIFNIIENKIRRDPQPLILLDFAVVTAVDKSFLDSFLRRFYEKYKNKILIGINIDEHIVLEDIYKKGINSELKKWGITFFVVTSTGKAYLLGSKYSSANEILSLILTHNKLTREQIAVQLDKNISYIKRVLNYLCRLGIIVEKKTVHNYIYYTIENIEVIKSKVGKTTVKIIEDLINDDIVDKGCFELPSGIYIDKLYHLSYILRNPRIVRMIGTHFANIMGDSNPDFILTTETPNNIALAYRFAQHISEETKIIYARKENDYLRLYGDFKITSRDRGIIVVDTVFTGYIANQLIKLVLRNGGKVIGVCSVLDLSNEVVNFYPYRYYSIVQRKVNSYRPEELKLCKKKFPITKPKLVPGDET